MNELNHWLRLKHSKGIGVASTRKLLDNFPDLGTALRAGQAALSGSGLSKNTVEALLGEADTQAIERDLTWACKPGNHILPFISPRYPARLRSINDAPLVLYVTGDVDVLHTAQLAMVGSRNPSHTGLKNAQQFAKHLAASGITITSGLAIGIDAASHEGALQGNGLTIAVAGTGLDRIYPAKHHALASRIITEGAMVSEFPIGTTARAEYFPRRNRIISGLSLGTLVVEAAVRSGSLSTAKHAMEQGREVFAIPGSIQNPMARGCHQLIKQGAKLVEVSDEIFEELAPHLTESRQRLAGSGDLFAPGGNAYNTPDTGTDNGQYNPSLDTVDPSYQQLLDCIDYEPQTIDTLIERSGLAAAEVASMLLMLELNGHINRTDGSKFVRC